MKNQYDTEPEIICGYKVSSMRKKLWVSELNMLSILEDACSKNNLNYFLVFGSAIGAVRHNGFIPWDDDIDIGMLREDFDKFLGISKNYFPEYIDVQYGINEHGVDPLLRIRDSRTTGIINTELGLDGNKGAFIEIYPFDYVNENVTRKIQIFLSKKLLLAMKYRANGEISNALKDKLIITILKPFTTRTLWNMYRCICMAQNYNKKKCKYVDTISLPTYAMTGHHLFMKKDVEKTMLHDFEYTKVRIPAGYDNCLSTRYGDYMKLPPIEERGMHHSNIVFYDPEKPYTAYENSDILQKYFNGDNSFELL